jgi:hypothetical protein
MSTHPIDWKQSPPGDGQPSSGAERTERDRPWPDGERPRSKVRIPPPWEPPPRKRAARSGPPAPEVTAKRFSRLRSLPWRPLGLAAAPLALLATYLAVVAPAKVAGLEGVEVPYPEATDLLVELSLWCHGHPVELVIICLGILVPGMVLTRLARRYYTVLAIAATLTLGFGWYTISAPVDRLLQDVKDSIPEDHRVPSYNRSGPSR